MIGIWFDGRVERGPGPTGRGLGWRTLVRVRYNAALRLDMATMNTEYTITNDEKVVD